MKIGSLSILAAALLLSLLAPKAAFAPPRETPTPAVVITAPDGNMIFKFLDGQQVWVFEKLRGKTNEGRITIARSTEIFFWDFAGDTLKVYDTFTNGRKNPNAFRTFKYNTATQEWVQVSQPGFPGSVIKKKQ